LFIPTCLFLQSILEPLTGNTPRKSRTPENANRLKCVVNSESLYEEATTGEVGKNKEKLQENEK
jgi:hypothetical protein